MIDEFFTHFNYFPWFYALCVIISFLVVIATIIYTRSSRLGNNEQKTHISDGEESEDESRDQIDVLQAHRLFQRVKHKKIYNKFNLSSEQLDEEKESESKSLAAIYQLLQDRQDIFPGATMNDLEDQLDHLYKFQE